MLAASALNHAVAAGDRALAVRAATLLAGANEASPQARFLLFAEAIRTRDWTAAAARIDGIAEDELFGFLAPLLRAWTAVGSRRGDPLAILDAAAADPVAQTYLPEHRALLGLLRRRGEGAADFAGQLESTGPRAQRLRIATAAYLARRRNRREALGLLTGSADPIARARALIEARRPVPGEISTAATGIAELFARLSLDLNGQEVRSLALSFARIATFLAPDNSEARLIVAELLGEMDRPDAALAALAAIAPEDPFAGTARDVRTRILLAAGRGGVAIEEARSDVASRFARVSDWTRLADLYGELDRPREAAEAYGRAIAVAGENSPDQPLWAMWLMRGGALERGGDWPGGLAALRRAHELAPNEPLVLNYLGYAQLERRENVAEATRLVAEAHRLAPDNAAIADSLGWAHVLAGDLAAGIPLLEQAARGEPADVTINEHLGDAYFRAGRRIEARYAWKAALVYAEGEDRTRLRAKIDAGLTPQLAAR